MSNDTAKNAAVTETAPSQILSTNEDPMELAVSSDRFQTLDLNDDLGGWIEVGRCEDQGEAIDLKDEMQLEDPFHLYKIVSED